MENFRSFLNSQTFCFRYEKTKKLEQRDFMVQFKAFYCYHIMTLADSNNDKLEQKDFHSNDPFKVRKLIKNNSNLALFEVHLKCRFVSVFYNLGMINFNLN